MTVARPRSVAEAPAALAEHPDADVLGGGTDDMVAAIRAPRATR